MCNRVREALTAVTLSLMFGAGCSRQTEPDVAEIRHESSSLGILRISAALPEGKMTVGLPDDLVAGDTVSGWMSVLPPGEEWAVPAGPGEVLSGLTLAVGAELFPADDPVVVLTVPPGVDSLPLTLVDANGTLRARGVLPVAARLSDGSSELETRVLPLYIPDRMVLRLAGRFDGDHRNTTVRIEGQEFMVEVESPRSVIGVPGELSPGLTEVHVSDAGWERREPVSVLRVTARILGRFEDYVSVEATVDGFTGMPAHVRPILDFGTWHEGEQRDETSVELDPATADEGRIIVQEAFALPEGYRYSASVRSDWLWD